MAVDVPTKVTYLLKNMHEELVASNIEIRDTFCESIKFETVHRNEIQVSIDSLKDQMASEEDDVDFNWLDEEDPDANVEIYKETNEINIKVTDFILPYQEVEVSVEVVPLALVSDTVDLIPFTFKYAMGPMPEIPEIEEE